MLKHKEILSHMVLQVLILVIGGIGIAVNLLHPIWWLFLCGVALIVTNLLYTMKRYHNMKELTAYMTRIQNGKETLDIRDNKERELSILKNEVYKLSLKLIHQAELLQEDKVFLADSISDISHQLKTPLTSMMMMADLLEEGNLSEEKRQEFIHNIQLGLERMQWLVQALLKISKLDAGAVHMKREPVKMASLLAKATRPLLIPMEIKEQSFLIDGEEDIILLGDEQWLVEAISNILKNCMEHTKTGGTIRVKCGQNNLYTSITIEDNGVGIEKEDLPHIFERFYRGKNSSSESVGIGLALSRMIILQHKGTISVESEKELGTTFIIKLYSK